MIKPAIIAVGYNRPKQMKRLLNSIGAAYYNDDDIPLIISIDESDRSDEVEKVAQEFFWKYGQKIIRRFPKRQGLRSHIIQCGDLSEKYGAVIILEDDLLVSQGFYTYTQQAHKYYFDDSRICGISLYSHHRNQFTNDGFTPQITPYDVYLGKMVVTWGQSWTWVQWKKFKEWYQIRENNVSLESSKLPVEILQWKRSWGKYFVSYMVENNVYYVFPYAALSTCFADVGEHSINSEVVTSVQVPLLNGHMSYRFCAFDDAVKYDSFYEREFGDQEIAPGIMGSDVCVDLYGIKNNALGKKYLLTCRKRELPLKYSYGLRLRPIEDNVLYGIPGDDIFLYELSDHTQYFSNGRKNNYQYTYQFNRLRYEYYDMPWKMLCYYAACELKSGIRRRLKQLYKKIKI